MKILTEETGKRFYDPIVVEIKDTSLLDQLMFRFGIDMEVVREVIDETVSSCFMKKNILLEKDDIFELDFYGFEDFVPKDVKLINTGMAMAKITEMIIDTNQEHIDISYNIEIVDLVVSLPEEEG